MLEKLEPNRFCIAIAARRPEAQFPARRHAQPKRDSRRRGHHAGKTSPARMRRWRAKGLAGKPRLLPEQPLEETRMMSEGAAFIVRDILESGGPVGRATEGNANSRQGIALENRHQLRLPRCLGSRRLRPLHHRHLGWPTGWHAEPRLLRPRMSLRRYWSISTRRCRSKHLPMRSAASQRNPPDNVTQAQICWPLGVRADEANAPYCHQQRTAWLLNGLAPATFADRLRSGEPRISYYIDPKSGQRVLPECAKTTARAHRNRALALCTRTLAGWRHAAQGAAARMGCRLFRQPAPPKRKSASPD